MDPGRAQARVRPTPRWPSGTSHGRPTTPTLSPDRSTIDDNSRVSRAVLAAAAVLLIGLVLTGGIAVLRYRQAHTRAEERFSQSADQARSTVEAELGSYIDRLQDLGTYLVVEDRPTPDAFERFVGGSRFFDDLEPLSGVIVIERVERDDVEGFVAGARTAIPELQLIELAPSPPGPAAYLITYYVDGDLGVEIPAGVDISSVESVRAVLETRSRTGQVAAGAVQNDPVIRAMAEQFDASLAEGLLGQIDFIIAVPVYRPGESPATGALPANWVAATVEEFDTVLQRPFAPTGGELGATLTVRLDDPAVSADVVERVAEAPDAPGSIERAAFTRRDSFEVDGLQVALVTWSSPDAAEEGNEAIAFTLVAGIIASCLGAAVVYLRGRTLTRERSLSALEVETERAQLRTDILASVTEAVVVLDGEGMVVSGNPAWDRLRGRQPIGPDHPTPDEGRPYLDVLREVSPLGAESVAGVLTEILTGKTDASESDIPVVVDGRQLWKMVSLTTLHGDSGGAVVVHRDITRRKESEVTLARQATQDPLTGLLNRSAFEDEARRAVDAARDTGAPIGALFIDLDDFKNVNDDFNHSVGDAVLRTVAQRISHAVRTTDAVARQGGDEFVVLLRDLPDPATADITAARILQALEEPVAVGDLELVVRASIGVVVLTDRRELSVAGLLAMADQAMYQAKDRGGSRFVKLG